MKVKLINTMAGPEGVSLSGSVVEFDQKTAMDLVSGGYAVAIEEPQKENIKQTIKKPKKGR